MPNDSILRNMTTAELLRYADRTDAVVKELCERLERYKEAVNAATQNLYDARTMAEQLQQPIQAE